MTKSRNTGASIYNIYEAKTNLSGLVERALRGEEIVIAKSGVPKVKLVSLAAPMVVREPGGWEKALWLGPDWEAPMTPEEAGEWEPGADGLVGR